MSTLKTAALYIRVSTHMQDELSPDAQQRLLLDYARTNSMLVPKEFIFIEKGISGRKADRRPQFQRMISIAKQSPSPFNMILVWKYSRFARNQEESIVYKSLLRRQCKVDVISVSEPVIDGPFGSLIERVIEWMDEYYSIRLSGEVFRGMTEKALRGGYQSYPPLGYCRNKTTGIPDICEPEAEIVRKIYALFEEGKSNIEIARQLNSTGYRTRKGNTFECRSIEYILTNPFYCGKIRWNRQDHSNHTIKDKSEWIIADGVHETLFDEEYYNHIQDIISMRKKPSRAKSVGTMRTWLSGMVKCSACGASLVANTYKKSVQCGMYNKGACFESHFIKIADLEQAVYNALNDVISKNTALKLEISHKNNDNYKDTAALKKQLKNIEIKFDRIKQSYRNGIDTLEEYKENKEILIHEKETLTAALDMANIISDDTSNAAMPNDIKYVYDIIADTDNDDRTRSLAFRSLVDHCVYHKTSDELQVYFYLLV